MVTINSGFHPNYMPTFRYEIVINGVTITLNKEDFLELCQKLGDKISEDYIEGKKIYEDFWNEKRNQHEFLSWLDGEISEEYSTKEPLSHEKVSAIYDKLINILY